MQDNLTNMRQKWSKMKPSKTTMVWIVIGTIILTMIIGFSRGGWVTGGNSQLFAERSSSDAVVDRLALICVAQFNEDPQKEEKLAELKELILSNGRLNYVKEQGWATMPGETEADNRVASECARQLLLIDE